MPSLFSHKTFMTHDCPGTRLPPQSFVWEKAPVIVTPMSVRFSVPKLLNDTFPLVLQMHPRMGKTKQLNVRFVADRVAFGPETT